MRYEIAYNSEFKEWRVYVTGALEHLSAHATRNEASQAALTYASNDARRATRPRPRGAC